MSDLPATILLRSEEDGSDGRSVEIRIMPWDQAASTPEGREQFERGAFAGTDPARVTIESQRHGGTLVGRGTSLVEHDDAAYLHARISRTAAGDELLELVRDGVVTEASVAFLPVRTSRRKGVLVRQAVDLRRVAILERGSYQGAGVVAVRSESEDQVMAEQITEVEPTPVSTALLERLERLDDRVVQLQARAAVVMPEPEPIAYRAETLGELLLGAWSDDALRTALAGDALLERVLVDQLTTANAGLVPPGVISRAATIVNFGRPSINAVGTGPLPASGMQVSWPVMTTPLTGLIAKQATEKTAIQSGLVSFGNATANIATFAGGSDISVQLIRRSSPAYLEQYARAMLAAWAMVTDSQFLTDVQAGAVGAAVIITTSSTAQQIIDALVAASIRVETATGSPATAVVVASDLFARIASVYAPTSVNPTATGGTAMASTLAISVSGLKITHDRLLSAGTGFVTNSTAAEWLEDGPNQISADDVNKLGQNVAYWSLGVTALYIPTGVVKIAAA